MKAVAVVRDHAVLLTRIAVPLVLVGIWELLGAVSDQVASPGPSINALVTGFSSGGLGVDVSQTLRAVVIGFAIAVVIGIPLGVWAGRSPYLYRVAEPIFSGTAAVPRIVLLPILLGLFGITVNEEAGMSFLAAIVPVTVTTMAGARTVHPILIKLGRSLTLPRRDVLRKVIIPAAMPPIMAGLRIGFSLSLLTVILCEFVAASHGVGLRIQQAYSLNQLPLMYGLVTLVVVFGFAANMIAWGVERRTAT